MWLKSELFARNDDDAVCDYFPFFVLRSLFLTAKTFWKPIISLVVESRVCVLTLIKRIFRTLNILSLGRNICRQCCEALVHFSSLSSCSRCLRNSMQNISMSKSVRRTFQYMDVRTCAQLIEVNWEMKKAFEMMSYDGDGIVKCGIVSKTLKLWTIQLSNVRSPKINFWPSYRWLGEDRLRNSRLLPRSESFSLSAWNDELNSLFGTQTRHWIILAKIRKFLLSATFSHKRCHCELANSTMKPGLLIGWDQRWRR